MRLWKYGMSSVLWVIAGCHDDGGIALSAYPEAYADMHCRTSDQCHGAFVTGYGDVDGCRAEITTATDGPGLAQFMAVVEGGTAIYHPELMARCLAELEALGCDRTIAATPASCRDAFEGTIPLGQPCSLSQECEGDAYCEGAACPATAGTCAARGADGEGCWTVDECQSGLACQAGICQPPGSMSGGPCGGSTGLSCPLDELCVNDAPADAGICTPLSALRTRQLDEPCTLFGTELCEPELVCAMTALEVQACKAAAPSGGSCFYAAPSMCPAGEYCDANPVSDEAEGTCTPLPRDGEACGSPEGRCANGLSCDTAVAPPTCVRLADLDQSCERDADCRSRFCAAGACAAPPLCAL